MAVVQRAGAAPLWWLGVVAAGAGLVPEGLTGRRIGVLVGALLFLLAAAVVPLVRGGRAAALAAEAERAARSDILQARSVTVRNWRRGHRWWLLLAFAAALGSAFALPAAGGMVLSGWGTGLWLRARGTGRVEEAREVLLWTAADALGRGAGDPLGARTTRLWTTGTEAGDAAPGGGRRR
ncbi:hypothetical protein [Streptomyces sp. CBG33]|uniref:hypothetical protein n=1 Tax=Streptomyces sp. CBG33 TaxID=2762624 RepID=UPI0016460C1D|nr:hypothetical protein [Streptomyces sp. CBG33]